MNTRKKTTQQELRRFLTVWRGLWGLKRVPEVKTHQPWRICLWSRTPGVGEVQGGSWASRGGLRNQDQWHCMSYEVLVTIVFMCLKEDSQISKISLVQIQLPHLLLGWVQLRCVKKLICSLFNWASQIDLWDWPNSGSLSSQVWVSSILTLCGLGALSTLFNEAPLVERWLRS